jgi:hypothetical protein
MKVGNILIRTPGIPLFGFSLRDDAVPLAFARKSLATWAISGDQCIVTAFSGG